MISFTICVNLSDFLHLMDIPRRWVLERSNLQRLLSISIFGNGSKNGNCLNWFDNFSGHDTVNIRSPFIMQDQNYDLTRNVHRITLYNTVSDSHQHYSNRKDRLFLHLDMNCFYAQVEQQAYNLWGMPVIIGGWRKKNGTPRGIVATSSYEARAYGIKTGMSHYEAYQLCPYLIPLQVHYDKYHSISRDILQMFENYAPEVESYSMDEVFLDVTYLKGKPEKYLREIAQRIKDEIYDLHRLKCSVGISYTKTYAKLASDIIKPDGLVLVLNKQEAAKVIHPLPIKEVWGVGRKRTAKLNAIGINTIQDAIDRGDAPFRQLFGDYFGKMLFLTCTGQDIAKVMDNVEHTPQEVCFMHTFSDWSLDAQRIKGELAKGVRQLGYRMRGYKKQASKFSCYIRFQSAGWSGHQVMFMTEGHTNLDAYILDACEDAVMPAVRQFTKDGVLIRGIGLSTIDMIDNNQPELFFQEDQKTKDLFKAMDSINNRFGLNTLQKATDKWAVEGNTHFLER